MSPLGVSSPLEYAAFQSVSTSPPVSVWPPSVCSLARWRYIWCPDSAADAFAAKFRLDGAPGTVSSSRSWRRSRERATGLGRPPSRPWRFGATGPRGLAEAFRAGVEVRALAARFGAALRDFLGAALRDFVAR